MVLFGDTTDLSNKFEKFKLFYAKVIPVHGWSKYNKINLQYKNQVVASIRGKQDIIADSLRTLQIMKKLAEFSSKMASDTTQNHSLKNEIAENDISLILQSFSREDSSDDEQPVLQQSIPVTTAPRSNSKPNASMSNMPGTGQNPKSISNKNSSIKNNTPNKKP